MQLDAVIINLNKYLVIFVFYIAGHCVSGSVLANGWRPIIVRLGEHNLQTSPDCDGVS